MIAVIIPCYRVKDKILSVLKEIGPEASAIYVVDDCCPEKSGAWVEGQSSDPRVRVIYNKTNLGVGGAVMEGFKRALKDGADILVKIDGDYQMEPKLIPPLLSQ